MPCYLFTYHGYGTWLPDREEGFVRRKQGVLPPNVGMATRYRQNMQQAKVLFDDLLQVTVIDELLKACAAQHYRPHYFATDVTHIHVLVSWNTDRKWEIVRAKLRESMTRRLNVDFTRKEWFSKSASRRHVTDQAHFDHLVSDYLARHGGRKWQEGQGIFL